jgi:hypothetical protein
MDQGHVLCGRMMAALSRSGIAANQLSLTKQATDEIT